MLLDENFNVADSVRDRKMKSSFFLLSYLFLFFLKIQRITHC